jgi:hypothetical protein
MADEAVEQVSDAVATDAKVEEAKVESTEQVAETKEPHTLEPGGDRFKQVWSRAKQAEERLRVERDARIAAEAKLETLKEVGVVKRDQPAAEKVFSWAELEQAIADGKLTRAEALDYREKQVIRQAKDQAREEWSAEQHTRERTQTIAQQLEGYLSVEPSLKDVSSELRQKVEREYQWLVSVHGEPARDSVQYRAMELNAVKNVLGPIDSIKRKQTSERMTRDNLETHMDRSDTSQRGNERVSDDENKPPKGLTAVQIAHYEKMFVKSSAYPNGWADVRKELAYAPKPKVRLGR